MQKQKYTLHVASRRMEESTFNPLKSLMSTVTRNTFSKLFQFHAGHGVLEKYFQTRCIRERKRYCKCSRLETAEYVLNECLLHPPERGLLRNVSSELDPKKNFEAVTKFLDSLPQPLCRWFAWIEQFVEVSLSISGTDLLGVMYNSLWRTRRHRTSELIVRADSTIFPVS